MPELKPWKMKRAELVEKLDDLLIDYDQKATVPELQEILKKHMTKTEELAKGYTRFTVGELREMCNKKKLRVPATANKGCLIQALRYAEGGHSKEEITFGRYKGKTYEAIPMDYRLWAVEEVSKNETPAAALVRFATWAKRWMELEALEEEVIDPEEAAVVAPPKSTMDFKPTIRKKAMTSTTTAKRATPGSHGLGDGCGRQQEDPGVGDTVGHPPTEATAGSSRSQWKRRRYWAVREGRAKQKAVAKLEKIGEFQESSGDLTANEDNLDYDDDIEHRINSRRGRKVKNSTRKMIGSWTRKVWQAFLSTAVALAGPIMVEANEAVVEPIKDLYNATVLPRFEEEGQPYVLEVFAGKNHITQAFAAKGHDVMEPRDLLLGHDIRVKEVRENILEDIRKFKPKLVWLAPPCTLWSPWTRINYYGRANQLRRLRQRERMFQEFAEECARLQRSGGRHIIIENPAQSELRHTPRMMSITKGYHLLECNLDMCAYGLKGKSDGKLLKKPTKLLVSSEIYQHELARRCYLVRYRFGALADPPEPWTPQRPGTQRPAKTVLPMDFNDEAAVDLFQGKVKHSILSVMDLASGYHVCRKIQSKLSEDLAESVRQLWLEWAGMPKRMVCDQERGFQKNFVDEMENRGIHVKYIAGGGMGVGRPRTTFGGGTGTPRHNGYLEYNLAWRTDSQTEDKNYYQQTLRAATEAVRRAALGRPRVKKNEY
ncbi:unnamed protein product, partial [Effrenium voratum]